MIPIVGKEGELGIRLLEVVSKGQPLLLSNCLLSVDVFEKSLEPEKIFVLN